ncbi:Transposase IS200 like protein [Planctomycetes bacterium Pan216]|uniref:Transposase IS200 like protein n=1 Tax=Kolteria novifilia TaxID=2527975 RepID=A0A518BD38_9BACT|nr:Transposase IS200 like protein [Planctomycetes bacterium Pan216]
MGQSLVEIYVHLIWSTKERIPFLNDNYLRNQLHAYLATACRSRDSPAQIVGGVEDHVHLLCRLGKSTDIAALVRDLKRETSKWIKNADPPCGDFQWQQGYGAFSISPSHLDKLTQYIAHQEQHHETLSFEDEFRRLCVKYRIEIDERYVWD